ncbi:MAG: molybdopterin-guanine dinucleotide biosynthesis protein B, partial [Deltaproteobacteria bacterium]|nr:molybdopterin-guanine dinucleotide biosynthesis protein B [Deltaproteobacteria bacterium]
MPKNIISIVGLSGSGKTTVLEKLITELSERGLKVGTIKHSCHPHPVDAPGKDSWRHREAGAV